MSPAFHTDSGLCSFRVIEVCLFVEGCTLAAGWQWFWWFNFFGGRSGKFTTLVKGGGLLGLCTPFLRCHLIRRNESHRFPERFDERDTGIPQPGFPARSPGVEPEIVAQSREAVKFLQGRGATVVNISIPSLQVRIRWAEPLELCAVLFFLHFFCPPSSVQVAPCR